MLGLGLLCLATEQVYGGWEQVPEILDRISAPTFPNRDFTVTDYGAVINFFVDPNKYLPAVLTRFEGIECMNYSPLVYAYEQQNISKSVTDQMKGL